MTTQNNTDTQATDIEIVENFNNSLDNDCDSGDAKKIKAFVKWQEDCRDGNPLLTIAVIEQFGVDSFINYAEDVARHGITGGYSGFTYYNDTEEFYTNNRDLIIEWAKKFRESIGIDDNLVSFVAGFNSMKSSGLTADEIGELIYSNDSELDNFTTFANNMAWGVGEEVCHNYSDFLEEYEDEEEDE